MIEVLQQSEGADSEAVRAGLANQLRQRWLQMLYGPYVIPSAPYSANVCQFDPGTGQGSLQPMEFHGQVLATQPLPDDTQLGPMRRTIFLGTDGSLIEIIAASFKDQRSWWSYTTVDKLAADPGLAQAVIAGFDRLRKGVIAPPRGEPEPRLPSGILAFPARDGGDPTGGFSA